MLISMRTTHLLQVNIFRLTTLKLSLPWHYHRGQSVMIFMTKEKKVGAYKKVQRGTAAHFMNWPRKLFFISLYEGCQKFFLLKYFFEMKNWVKCWGGSQLVHKFLISRKIKKCKLRMAFDNQFLLSFHAVDNLNIKCYLVHNPCCTFHFPLSFLIHSLDHAEEKFSW